MELEESLCFQLYIYNYIYKSISLQVISISFYLIPVFDLDWGFHSAICFQSRWLPGRPFLKHWLLMGVPRKQLLKMRGIQKPWFPALLWPLLWLESWNLRGAPRQVPATNCQRKLQDWDQTMIVPVENCMPHHQFERGDWAYQSFFVLVPYTSPTVLLQPFWSLMPTLLLTPAHQVCWQWCLHGPHHKDSGWDMSMWKVNLFQQIQQWPQRHLQVSGYLLVPREASTRCICLSLIIWAGLNVTIICFTRYSLNQSALEYNQISTSHEYLKFYLTQIYETMRGTRRGAREWSFLGKRISHKCIAAIWGIRPQRFARAGSGLLDLRYRCFGAETKLIWKKHVMC
jgi:hypothetical protein